MKTVYFFRHGETDWNAERRLQGRTNIPLNEKGRAQAHRLGLQVKAYPITRIVSSPLQRAFETATIVSSYLNARVDTDSRLVELNYGDAEGCIASEISTKFPPETIEPFTSLSLDASYPNGETNREASSRFRNALEEILADPATDHVGICAHGGVFRRFVLLEFQEDHRPESLTVPNCELFIIRFDPLKSGFWLEG